MALIDTVPTTKVTVPTFLVGKPNGQLPESYLRSIPGEATRMDYKMFVPVSYAMQALHLASKGIADRTTGRYRSYNQQEGLFRSRYARSPVTTRGSKQWDSDGDGVKETWYNQQGAMAAVPGTSNHGLGLADDVAEETDSDPSPESMSDNQLTWMRDNAPKFGFGLETRKERWHWHWIGGNALSQAVVDTLDDAGVSVPDLSFFGFTVPKPSGSVTPSPTPGTTEEMMMSGFNILAKASNTVGEVGAGSWWAGNGYGRIFVNGADFAKNIVKAGDCIDAKDGSPVPATDEKWTTVTAIPVKDIDRLLGPWRK